MQIFINNFSNLAVMVKNRVNEFIGNPKKAFFTMSLPILVGMSVQALYNIVDTAFIGRLGSESIAALTFAFPLFFIFIALNSGVGSGINSLVSRFLGANKRKDAENAAIHGLFISIGLAIIIFVLGMIFLKPIFLLFGAKNNVMELSIQYMSIILYGVFFMFPSFVFNSLFSAQGDTKTPMKVQISALILNIILDPIFIYGLDYGVRGAAIATIIAFLFSLILFIYYLEKKSYLRFRLKYFKPSLRICREIFMIGAPASLMVLIISFYVMFINRFMAHFGTDYIASFGIASRLESLAIMPIVAFSLSLLTLVGMFFGAKRYDLLRSISWYGIKTATLMTSAIGLVFFIFPGIFLRIFTSDPSLLSIGAPFLRIDVLTFPLMTVTMLISRVMQGMGHGMPGLIVNLIRVFAVAVPLAYIFVFVFGFGYLSIALAMIIGGLVSSIVAVIWLEMELRGYDGIRH